MAKLSATVTTTETVNLKSRLSPKQLTELKKAVQLHEQLTVEIKERKAKQVALKDKVFTVFKDAKQMAAFMDGLKVDDVPVKYVCGQHNKFDKEGFVDDGGDLDLIAKHTHKHDSKPYVKIGKGGGGHGEDE